MPLPGTATAASLPAGMGYAVQQVLDAGPAAVVYALMAMAYALVYGLIGRVNLAFGAFAALGGLAALLALVAGSVWGAGAALALATLAATASPGAYGVAAARLVFAPLRGATGQQTLVATIGLALLFGEYVRLIQGPQPRWISPLLDSPIVLAKDGSFLVTGTPIMAVTVAAATLAMLLLAVTMRRSAFGRNWRAFRDDPGAAALFGVSRDRLMSQTLAIAGALAGLAGAITVLLFGEISFTYAQVLGLKALTAAVLGGIGSVSGAFWGGLAIAAIEAVWSSAFSIVNRDLVVFTVLVATLIWRPGGFFGERDLVPRRV